MSEDTSKQFLWSKPDFKDKKEESINYYNIQLVIYTTDIFI